ncbi:MAG: orotate phosphoribosyltransferase [Alphaproteobacteria bacterium]|nr:orotate phosphoribosyltransferase [Alphaproteobacteria bacterium]MCY4608463.1 orotate phosphoribosyltransferase [bacterium]
MSGNRETVLRLIRELAVMNGGDFELASGERSAVYIDLRRVTMHPLGASAIGHMIHDRLADTGVDSVGGMATAAIPVVTAVVCESQRRSVPVRGFYVRDKAKTRGTQRRIEGLLEEGDKVVLLEDTMTTGQSTMAAVEAVREAGATVVRVITVVDRLRGGAALFADSGISFEALFTLDGITGDGRP